MSRLWYRQPAAVWEEALPLGNGRLGAMVFGREEKERIQLNEESVWFGGKKNRINPDAARYLPKIRELIRSGNIREAQELMGTAMTGCPNSVNPYQTLGDMKIYFRYDETAGKNVQQRLAESPDMEPEMIDHAKAGYERNLDLAEGICRVDFKVGKTTYRREHFVSGPADCMIVKMSASQAGKISFTMRLERGCFFEGVEKVCPGEEEGSANGIWLYGRPGDGGNAFAMMAKCIAKGGTVSVIGESLLVDRADEVCLVFGAVTQYRFPDADVSALKQMLNEHLEEVLNRDYETLKAEHIRDHQALYNRVKLELYEDEPRKKRREDPELFEIFQEDLELLPTDERLKLMAAGKQDLGLQSLLFDYGRYLLIAGSREGTLPLTLQGLWNQDFTPPWGSKYTININTEMNYWPVESCNLSECHLPLFDLLEKMRESGRETARKMYGCRGFVAHHNTDIHGDCAPQDLWYPATYWPMGAAWLCTHLWTHYLYTMDLEFLKRAFPVLAESALFFTDMLVEKDGYLVTSPSVSPENTYILPDGTLGCVCEGPTMDNQILRDLFRICLDSYGILGEEANTVQIPDAGSISELMEQIGKCLEKLPPTKIGSDGRIMEWLEEYPEAEPGHRHISQLYGLYPSDQITADRTPGLAAAAAKTLKERLAHGGGHTGWSRAWIMNHYAKLWDGEEAYGHLVKMLTNSIYPNLFDKHPPFQIDGNFGATAAIAQMLVQSSRERVVLLPALPKAWKNGKVRGLRLVGNAQIDLEWEDGVLTGCTISADSNFDTIVKYGDNCREVHIQNGESMSICL